MSELSIGRIIETQIDYRDAVHIAVAAVVAGEVLAPGQHVGFVGERVGEAQKPIGVVDPFLRQEVQAGQRFWLFLYPNTITSLRHEWHHPAFAPPRPTTEEQRAGEAWLRSFAEEHGEYYEYMIEQATNVANGKERTICFRSTEAAEVMYEDRNRRRFWECFTAATGIPISHDPEEHLFRCAC